MSPVKFAAAMAQSTYVQFAAPQPIVQTVAPYPYSMVAAAPQVAAPYVHSSQPTSYNATPVTSAVPSRAASPVPTTEPVACTRSSSITQQPTTAAKEEKHYVTVNFKHDTYPYEAPFRVSVGDFVIVDGDRGENFGVVKHVTTVKPNRPVASKVLRKASAKDRDTHAALRRKEQAATKFCENAVKEIGLSMSIVDTEYQFDQNKLSIFFKSKGMVDFRRLQRVLFREFRCRVWMVNWNEVEVAKE